jgi:hypothetical protein
MGNLVVVAMEMIDIISFIVGCVFIISEVGADLSVLMFRDSVIYVGPPKIIHHIFVRILKSQHTGLYGTISLNNIELVPEALTAGKIQLGILKWSRKKIGILM